MKKALVVLMVILVVVMATGCSSKSTDHESMRELEREGVEDYLVERVIVEEQLIEDVIAIDSEYQAELEFNSEQNQLDCN